MHLKVVTAAVFLALCATQTRGDEAADEGKGTWYRGWYVWAHAFEDGRFAFCATGATYANDLTLLFLLWYDAALQVVAEHAEFGLPADQTYNIEISLDGQLTRTATVAVANTRLTVDLPPDPPFLDKLRTAHTIIFKSFAGDFPLPLYDSGLEEAVPAMVACLAEEAGLAPDGRALTQ